MIITKKSIAKSFIVCLMFSACSKGGIENENGISFDTEKLKGKYKMDLTPLIDEKFSQSDNSSDSKNMANGLASMAINSSLSIDLEFYNNKKGILKMNTGWIGKLVGTKNENIPFNYELIDDSVLVLNSKETSKLIIRKFNDSFDYIEFVNKEKSQKVIFTKISEI